MKTMIPDGHVVPTYLVDTVADLIEVLQMMDPKAVPVGPWPPFTGVRVVSQTSGHVLICPPLSPVEPDP